jgi:pimeloyl-ACP methyl ester carboxylesterase
VSLVGCWPSTRVRTLRSAVAVTAIVILTPAVPRMANSRTVSMRADDGVAIAGTFYEASRRPAPAVILLHMLTRSREDWDAVANRLADAGLHALAIDFRGHGGSSAGPPAAGGGPDLTRLVLDVQAARAFLVGRADLVIPSAIGIAGASVGANVAVLEGAGDPAVRSLALLSAGLDYRSLRTDAALRKYGGRPALLVAGTNDPYALRSAKDLAAGGGGVREIRILENAGHGTTMLKGDHDLGRLLVDWFQRTLL